MSGLSSAESLNVPADASSAAATRVAVILSAAKSMWKSNPISQVASVRSSKVT